MHFCVSMSIIFGVENLYIALNPCYFAKTAYILKQLRMLLAFSKVFFNIYFFFHCSRLNLRRYVTCGFTLLSKRSHPSGVKPPFCSYIYIHISTISYINVYSTILRVPILWFFCLLDYFCLPIYIFPCLYVNYYFIHSFNQSIFSHSFAFSYFHSVIHSFVHFCLFIRFRLSISSIIYFHSLINSI